MHTHVYFYSLLWSLFWNMVAVNSFVALHSVLDCPSHISIQGHVSRKIVEVILQHADRYTKIQNKE